MDVLLQRVGRLHRHAREPHERPEPCQQARAIVLVPTGHSLDTCLKKSRHGLGRFHQGGGIYMDLRILEATRRLISGGVSHVIPQDNRELVERATHPDVLADLEKELGDDWAAHGGQVLGDALAAISQGKHSVVDFKKHFWVLDESFYEIDYLHFTGEEQHVSSRLGSHDYLLTFEPPQPGPFGQAIQHLPVRHHMWPNGVSPDEPPRNLSPLTGGGFTFLLGDTTYRYSRLGLERVQTQEAGATP